jgi:hypothetical protein
MFSVLVLTKIAPPPLPLRSSLRDPMLSFVTLFEMYEDPKIDASPETRFNAPPEKLAEFLLNEQYST